MRYLLVTHIVSDLSQPQADVAQHIRTVGEAQVCTSIIVAAELRYGAAKKGSLRLSAQLEAVLGALEVLPFETPADATYGLLRTRLEQTGRPIGANDLLIAAQALALGHTIITDNEKEFPGSRTFDARIGHPSFPRVRPVRPRIQRTPWQKCVHFR